MLLRRLLLGAAALVLSGAPVAAAEGPSLEVRAGLALGVVEKATCSLDSMDLIEYRSMSLQASVEIVKKFAAGWSAEVRFRGSWDSTTMTPSSAGWAARRPSTSSPPARWPATPSGPATRSR
jgi:hypothetical protein